MESVGVRAVVENASGFQAAIGAINKAIDSVTAKTQAGAAQTPALGKALDVVGKSAEGITGKLQQVATQALGPLGPMVSTLISQLEAIPGPAAAAALAVAAITAAFVALAERGAAFSELIGSFDRLTASVDSTANGMFTRLRDASEGTIANLDLIRMANQALIGATGDLGRALGEALPNFMRAARVEADATGRSTQEMFDAFVTAARKGQTRALESAGIIIDAADAQRKYAEQVGKSADALNGEEKRIAILQAVVQAADQAVTLLGDAQESNADKMERTSATITNIFDTLALAVQPAFGFILDAVNGILARFQALAEQLEPILEPILSIVGALFGDVINQIGAALDPLFNLFGQIAPYLTLLVQGIANVFFTIRSVIQNTVGQVVTFLQKITGNFFGIDFNNLVAGFARGGAFMIGALAAGIMQAANTLVFPAIKLIAKTIADFLVGMSPPPEGPLSEIDRGGANTMLAWLQGFVGVSLEPVKQVAANVTALMGDIAAMSAGQVEAALSKLDAAIQPYKDQLSIVQATYDAINDATQPALDAIDAQMAKATQALLTGQTGADATVRALDAQKDAIQGALDLQTSVVDQAKIQLALAEAQQSRERALLTIRKAQAAVTTSASSSTSGKKATSGGTTATATKPKKEKQPSGGGAPEDTTNTGAGAEAADSVLGSLTNGAAVDAASLNLQQGFVEGLASGGDALGAFNANVADVETQIGRIGSVDVGAKIKTALGKIPEALDETYRTVMAKVRDIGNFLADPNTVGSLPYFFNTLPARLPMISANIQAWFTTNVTTPLQTLVSDLGTQIFTTLSGVSIDFSGWFNTAIGTPLRNLFNGLLANTGQPGTLMYFFSNLPANILGALMIAASGIQKNVIGPLNNTIITPIANAFSTLTGDVNTPGSILNWFSTLPQKIGEATSTIGATIIASLVSATVFLTGDSDDTTTLTGILNTALASFIAFPAQIGAALKSVGLAVWDNFVVPIINLLNHVVDAFNQLKQDILLGLGNLTASAATALMGIVPDIAAKLNEATASLQKEALQNPIPHIDSNPPGFLTGAATGGLFGPGALRVGERGPELIANASRVAVFPNSVVRALEMLSSSQSPYVSPSVVHNSSMNTTYDRSMTNVFNGVGGERDVARRLKMMGAFR